MEKYFEVNKSGQNIHCKLYFSNGSSIEKVVLFGHGFAGHKDNGALRINLPIVFCLSSKEPPS